MSVSVDTLGRCFLEFSITLGLEVLQSYKTLHYQTLSYLEFSGSSLVEIYFCMRLRRMMYLSYSQIKKCEISSYEPKGGRRRLCDPAV